MTTPLNDALSAIGLAPAPPATPPPWFEPVVVDEHLAFVSGQVAFGPDGVLVAVGRLGDDVATDIGNRCARQCAANALAALDRRLGGLDAITRILKLTVFVSSAPGYTDQPVVANGASEVLYDILGERGRHARSAIGVAALPVDSPVEIELIVSIARGSGGPS